MMMAAMNLLLPGTGVPMQAHWEAACVAYKMISGSQSHRAYTVAVPTSVFLMVL